MDKQTRNGIVEDFRIHDTDTGSPEVQIALLTKRVEELTEHFKVHKKDYHSRQGLLRIVGKRRKLLNYLKRRNTQRYIELIKELGIRK